MRITINSSRTDRAVSPVIGVILMVAITVILAAVIGTFVLDLGQSAGNSAPQASMQISADEGNVSITHQSGDALELETMAVVLRNESDGEPGRLTYDAESGWFNTTGDVGIIDASDLETEMLAGDKLITEFPAKFVGDVEVQIIDTESSNTVYATTIRA